MCIYFFAFQSNCYSSIKQNLSQQTKKIKIKNKAVKAITFLLNSVHCNLRNFKNICRKRNSHTPKSSSAGWSEYMSTMFYSNSSASNQHRTLLKCICINVRMLEPAYIKVTKTQSELLFYHFFLHFDSCFITVKKNKSMPLSQSSFGCVAFHNNMANGHKSPEMQLKGSSDLQDLHDFTVHWIIVRER